MGSQTLKTRPLDRDDLLRMRIPESFWKVGLKGVPQTAKDPLKRFLKGIAPNIDKGVSLLLVGPEGVGKTGISVVLAKKARSLGYTVFFTGLWELRDARRSGTKFDAEQSLMERARDVDLLVLDNLTEEDALDRFYGWNEVKGLLVQRGQRGKSTILTTQLGHEAKIPVLDLQGTVSRMILWPVTGPNLRLAANRELSKALLKGERSDFSGGLV